jgi:hypothetical protein
MPIRALSSLKIGEAIQKQKQSKFQAEKNQLAKR